MPPSIKGDFHVGIGRYVGMGRYVTHRRLIATTFGFGGIAATPSAAAKLVFFVAIILFAKLAITAWCMGIRRRYRSVASIAYTFKSMPSERMKLLRRELPTAAR